MGKLQTSGYKKYWPLKAFEGKRPDGSKITSEVFRDMATGAIHYPMDNDGNLTGWNGEPPPLPSGEKPVYSDNERYLKNYEMVKFDGGKLVNGKWIYYTCPNNECGFQCEINADHLFCEFCGTKLNR